MSNLRLADAKFLYGASGMNLDTLARKPFWDREALITIMVPVTALDIF